MKKILKITIIIFAITYFAGCSFYIPQSFWEESKTKMDLESNNFVVRKLGAQGSASTLYLFGGSFSGADIIGIPLGSQDIQARALRDFHQNWDGKGSCVLHNINVEWTNYGIPMIYLYHQYTITADIYEYNKEYVDYATRK